MATSITFYEQVEDALANSQLQQALNIFTTRFIANRLSALATLPEAEALRDHARLIRAHTLANLDTYLSQFAEAVEQRGGRVYWAETAEEATRYVVDLARAAGVRSAAFSCLAGRAGFRPLSLSLAAFLTMATNVRLAGRSFTLVMRPKLHIASVDGRRAPVTSFPCQNPNATCALKDAMPANMP